jgi:hypothetical protein
MKNPGKEHLIEISINLWHNGRSITETVLWDFTNPDNSPEELAA